MIIPITVPSQSSSTKLPSGLARISHDEVVLIELQGSLEVECKHISERDGKFVGKLALDEANNKPTLLIGHHLLEGKITNLTKPLAIIRRSRGSSSWKSAPRDPADGLESEDAQSMDVDDEMGAAPAPAAEKTVEWSVVAVVKKKIVFSKRPMPIVKLAASQ